jgi:non-canonical poly(A) RNA polymerase PAPD5/7
MDVVVISETFRTSGVKVACQNKSNMHRFGDYLRKSGVVEEDSVEVITSAKVPLIKFVDQMTGIKVDMSFENQTGLTANNTFNAWKNQFPAMPIIVTLIKQFLLMRGLNEVVNGGLGGFSVTCLVTSLMQNLPRIQSGELIPEQHLGEILIEFLDLYGNRLDTSRTGISMNPPGYFDKVCDPGHSAPQLDSC